MQLIHSTHYRKINISNSNTLHSLKHLVTSVLNSAVFILFLSQFSVKMYFGQCYFSITDTIILILKKRALSINRAQCERPLRCVLYTAEVW